MEGNVTQNKASGLAVASLVCGICSFIPGATLAALITGIIDLVKISNGQSSPKGKGMDIAGIVLSIVIPIIFFVIFFIIIWGSIMGAFGIDIKPFWQIK